MTLIEVVVVMALLAGLAAMALTSAAELGNRGRYDETTTRMKLIRAAVAGNGAEAGRFVRDMGRLPMAQPSDPGKTLAELWRDAGSIQFGAATNSASWPDSNTNLYPSHDVKLTCGWNGPYLMVDDPENAECYDGFGNPWVVLTNSIGEITNIVSRGAGNQEGGEAWDEEDRTLDLSTLLPKTELTAVVKGRASTNAGETAWSLAENAASNALPYQLDKLVIAVFTPAVDGSGRELNRNLKEMAGSAVCSAATFAAMPTDCLIYGYGTNAATGLQVSGPAPELVTLKPGRNVVTLYLREP